MFGSTKAVSTITRSLVGDGHVNAHGYAQW